MTGLAFWKLPALSSYKCYKSLRDPNLTGSLDGTRVHHWATRGSTGQGGVGPSQIFKTLTANLSTPLDVIGLKADMQIQT